MLELLIVLALLGAAALFVVAPLRAGREARDDERREAEVADLEAARAGKYREIRDAELDFRTGKLSEGDWREQDRALRAEAIEILRALDRLRGQSGPAG